MSLDSDFLSTRIGRSSTYRCQVGLHEFDIDHWCRHCGTEQSPVQAKVTKTESGSTILNNFDELTNWYRVEPHELAFRLLETLNMTGNFSDGKLTIHGDVTSEQIDQIMLK